MIDKSGERSYIFTQIQLQVLLSGMGYSYVYGLNLDEVVIDDNLLINTLNELVKTRLLTPDGNAFYLKDDIKNIIKTIGEAECFYTLRTSTCNLPDLCCYCNKKIVVCEMLEHRKNSLKISALSFDDFFDMLCDEGYLSGFLSDYKINEEEIELFEQDIEDESNALLPLSNDTHVLFDMSLFESGETKKYVKIIDFYIYKYIIFFNGKERYRLEYFKDKTYQLIFKLMEGNI